MSGDRGGMTVRHHVNPLNLEAAVELVTRELHRRIERHGHGSYASRHEVLGTLTEEWEELKDEVHDNSAAGLVHELLDVSTVVLFALASALAAKAMDDRPHSLYLAGAAALELLEQRQREDGPVARPRAPLELEEDAGAAGEEDPLELLHVSPDITDEEAVELHRRGLYSESSGEAIREALADIRRNRPATLLTTEHEEALRRFWSYPCSFGFEYHGTMTEERMREVLGLPEHLDLTDSIGAPDLEDVILEELETSEEWRLRRAEELATAIGNYGRHGPLVFDAETVDGLAIELRNVLEELAS